MIPFIITIALPVLLLVIFMPSGIAEIAEGVLDRREQKRARALPSDGLSEASKLVLKKYEEIPVGNRPVPNIVDTLRALDVKYGVNLATNHFVTGIGSYASDYHSLKNLNCNCFSETFHVAGYRALRPKKRGATCTMPEYKALFDAAHGVVLELRAQEKALKLAGVQSELNEVTRITEHLRQEKALISDVTKEITK